LTSIKIRMVPIWTFCAPLIGDSLAFGLAGLAGLAGLGRVAALLQLPLTCPGNPLARLPGWMNLYPAGER